MEFKGKWSISTEVAGNLKHIKIHNEKGIAIASMHRLPFTEKQLESNAKLISKAPEFLEMLKRSIEEIKHLKETYKDVGHAGKYLFQCEELIKEATTI